MSEQPTFSIDALELGPMGNLIHLIQDHATQRAAIVDPAWDVEQVLALAQQKGVQITDVLLTHSHHDHINGLETLLGTCDAQLHLLKAEADFWGSYMDLPTLHHGGDIIQLGETPITVWHTPGHTPGSACYHLDGHVVTGDTLFVFGCGRCDLRGGDPEQMFNTLKKLAADMPVDTVIHPGHNYADRTTSTLAEQQAGNPFMHFDKSTDFVEYRMHRHDKIRHTPYQAINKTTLMQQS